MGGGLSQQSSSLIPGGGGWRGARERIGGGVGGSQSQQSSSLIRAFGCLCVGGWVMKWVYPYVFVSALGSYEMGRHK